MSDPRAALTAAAASRGFATVRFATVKQAPYADRYADWIGAQQHGEMSYLAQHIDVRTDPRNRMPGAKTAMVLAVEHHHQRPPDPGGRTGLVARYAWGRDYHNLVGKRLKKLQRDLREQGIATWGGVDTAPILERSWASEAGLGFGGKNCVQIVPARTSWMFLAVLFVDVDVPPDNPLRDHCGSCARCLSACPTNAFDGPRALDARRCIAYWTIEARGLAPRHLRPAFGRWVFGCDLCQEVCPHNAAPPPSPEDDLAPRHAWLDLDELVLTPDDALDARFIGTPIRRPKPAGLKRNALIALGNLGDDRAVPTARQALTHPAAVVRASAVWCLARLGEDPTQHDDDDPLVREEIAACAAGEIAPAAHDDVNTPR